MGKIFGFVEYATSPMLYEHPAMSVAGAAIIGAIAVPALVFLIASDFSSEASHAQSTSNEFYMVPEYRRFLETNPAKLGVLKGAVDRATKYDDHFSITLSNDRRFNVFIGDPNLSRMRDWILAQKE